MAHDAHRHVDRFIPAHTNGGWGVAGLVAVLAILCIAGATYLHQTTYKHPSDVHMEAAGAHTPAVGEAH